MTPNPAYPSLSAKLEVTTGPQESNCSDAQVKVVSKEVMSAGQVVAIEKAVAHSVVNEHKLTNCRCYSLSNRSSFSRIFKHHSVFSHCLETVLVPVPCPGCIDIVFCTASCR